MTEYDYSPAAYERYMANQTRVSNWVHGQANHAAEYASPFVPHPASASSSSSRDSPLDDYDRYSRHKDYDRGRPSASRHSESSGRPHLRRPVTSPPPQQMYKSSRSSSQPRSHSHIHPQPPSHQSRIREVHVPPPPTRSRAHEYPHAQPHPQYAAEAYLPPSASGQRTYKTFTIDPSNTREIVLPPPRRGETYVIIPPVGQRVEVVHGSSSGGSQPSPSRSPTKKNNPPLIKRIFGAVGPSSSRTASHRERTSSY